MRVTERVRKILSNHESDNPGTRSNLARILSAGRLGGSGGIIGRNTFRRPQEAAPTMLGRITDIHLGRA